MPSVKLLLMCKTIKNIISLQQQWKPERIFAAADKLEMKKSSFNSRK